MRLALVHKRYDRLGGAEWDCYEMARRLALRGHEVHVVAGEHRVAPSPGVTLHRVAVARTGQLAKLLSFALLAPRVWRRLEPAVAIGFGRTVGEGLFRASGGCHRRYLERMAIDAGPLERLRRRLSPYQRALLAIERRQYAPAGRRRILVVSELARREALATYPAVGEGRVAVLRYGVDVERFRPENRARDGAAARRELGLGPAQPVVLLVGTGFRRKGVDVLLEIWRREPPAGAALVVAGADRRLAARRREAQALRGPVVFTGPRRDVERLYAAADLFVLPSRYDAFGMVVLEALASGLPVVTSRRIGAAEVLTGPLAELVVDEPRDADALAARLRLGLDPGCRAALGGAARAAACAASLEAAAAGLEGWCRTVAAGGDGDG